MTAAAVKCPPPPRDIKSRAFPVIEIDLDARPLYRIHRSAFSPIFYNRQSLSSSRYRFDAPDDEYGVIYGGFTFAACIFETVIRDRFENLPEPLIIGNDELEQRSLTRLAVQGGRQLRLADFTQSLAVFGGSTIILSIDDYSGPNLWSKAIHDAAQQLDGIYFQSRFSNEPSVAIFDRCSILPMGLPIPLPDVPDLDVFLDRFRISIV